MTETAHLLPLAGVAVASLFGGSALAPMRFQRRWRFEHTWLLYSLLAYALFPWLVAFATVPGLLSAYAAAGTKAIVLTALFGFGWGLAVVLNGYAVTLVGLAVTTGVLMGSSIAVGSILAILLVDPRKLFSGSGVALLLVNSGLMLGVACCSWAGSLREQSQSSTTSRPLGDARKGILLCLLAGVLSTLFNVALVYGQVISRQAEAQGASSLAASNSVWAVAVSAGSLPGISWCLLVLNRNAGWKGFTEGPAFWNGMRTALMAVLWISGTVLYGAAAPALGAFGPAVGWPVYMSGMIITASVWSWITGEWKGASRQASLFMIAGVVLQVIFLVAAAGVR